MAPVNLARGFVLAPFLLASCDRSSTTVKFELTDAPPDIASIAQVVITLDRVEAHIAGDDDDDDLPGEGGARGEDAGERRGGWRTVTPSAGTFDLMTLRNDVRAPLGELELSDGKITHNRLFVDPNGDNRVVLVNGESCALDLDQVPPTGVKIIHPFKALDLEGASALTIVIDFDAAESLDQAGACSFTLKPVIKVKAVERS